MSACVADDGRFPGGTGRGVHTFDTLLWYGKHAEGIVVAQVLFSGEGEFLQIIQTSEI